MKISVFSADEGGMAQLAAFVARDGREIYVKAILQGGVYLPERAPAPGLTYVGAPQEDYEPARPRTTWCFTVFYEPGTHAAPIEGVENLQKAAVQKESVISNA